MCINISLIIEILIGGAISSTWLVLLINKISGHDLNFLISILNNGQFNGLHLFLALVFAYILGWTSQYFSDLIFDNLIEKRVKLDAFNTKKEFYDVRAKVFNKCSTHILQDIEYDRQLLRISKLSCLGFAILAMVSLAYICDSLFFSLISFFISLFISGTSFLHWKKRFKSVMYKFKRGGETVEEHCNS